MTEKLWISPQVVPSLAYEDVPAAIEWLTRAFGFRERAEARLSGQGFVLAWMEIGDGLVCLTTPDSNRIRSPKNLGGGTQSVKVYVDDVDRHFEHAKAAGATIVSEPTDGFWGGRIYRASDREGHLWELAQIGRDLDAAKWDLPPGVRRGAAASR